MKIARTILSLFSGAVWCCTGTVQAHAGSPLVAIVCFALAAFYLALGAFIAAER